MNFADSKKQPPPPQRSDHAEPVSEESKPEGSPAPPVEEAPSSPSIANPPAEEDVRRGKIAAIEKALQDGSYRVSALELARKLIDDMLER